MCRKQPAPRFLHAARYLDGLPEGDPGSIGRAVIPGIVVVVTGKPTTEPVEDRLIEVNAFEPAGAE